MKATKMPGSFWNSLENVNVQTKRLENEMIAEHVIIGAGLTGLNAAWELMKNGADVVLLEASEPGWGASGRNAGMVVLRYKKNWSELAHRYGHNKTKRLLELLERSVAAIENNIRDLNLSCDFQRDGHITAAYTRQDLARLKKDVVWLKAEANYHHAQLLNKERTAELLGSNYYLGGYLDQQAAGLNPLAYCRELAAALIKRGLPLFTQTAVQQVQRRQDGYFVKTQHGGVKARRLIVATNGYTDLYPIARGISQGIVPVTTAVAVTNTIDDTLYRRILPQGHLVTDTKNLINYFRRLPGNRLLFGGQGSLSGQESISIYRKLHKQLGVIFPELRGTVLKYRWLGHVALTRDDFPHIGHCDNGGVFALGYGGRGVALSHLLGQELAALALGHKASLGPMSKELQKIPFHRLRLPLIGALTGYYWLRDKLRI